MHFCVLRKFSKFITDVTSKMAAFTNISIKGIPMQLYLHNIKKWDSGEGGPEARKVSSTSFCFPLELYHQFFAACLSIMISLHRTSWVFIKAVIMSYLISRKKVTYICKFGVWNWSFWITRIGRSMFFCFIFEKRNALRGNYGLHKKQNFAISHDMILSLVFWKNQIHFLMESQNCCCCMAVVWEYLWNINRGTCLRGSKI